MIKKELKSKQLVFDFMKGNDIEGIFENFGAIENIWSVDKYYQQPDYYFGTNDWTSICLTNTCSTNFTSNSATVYIDGNNITGSWTI